jgi:hypothetical protein
MRHLVRTLYLANRFALANRLSLLQAAELSALCTLAMARAGRPSGNLYLGQARAFVSRVTTV